MAERKRLHPPNYKAIKECLKENFQGTLNADRILETCFKTNRRLGSRDRKQIAESFYEIIRNMRLLQFLAIGKDSTKFVLNDLEWDALIEFYLDHKDELVHLAMNLPRAVRESIPNWLDELGRNGLGHEWNSILHALNLQAPVFLRVNTALISPEKLREKLMSENIECDFADRANPEILVLRERKNVFSGESFHQGLFEVQDFSSQMIAPFLGVQPGDRVIDACAGAGGKSLHMASLMKNGGKVIALDIYDRKLEELKRRARRQKLFNIETRLIDGTKTIKKLSKSADRMLLDVPCTGTGVLRRNPDAKWKLSQEKLNSLVKTQQEILQNYADMVKPGGTMVYCTCSVLPEENEQQVDAFLKSESGQNWRLDEKLNLRPDQMPGDGFFAARLIRS